MAECRLDSFTEDIIRQMDNGMPIEMDDYMKNVVNAYLADRLSIGDRVRVIKTGQMGRVVRKVVYGHKKPAWLDHGYTAIQVDVGGRKNFYAARSLQRVETMTEVEG